MTSEAEPNKSSDPVAIPSITEQFSWLMAAKVLSFAFSLALPLIVVRILTIGEYGLYREAFTVVTTLAGVLPLGMGMSAFYYLSRDQEKRPYAIFNILLLHIVAGGAGFLLLAFFPGILRSIFGSGEIESLSFLIGVLTWLWVFSLFLDIAAVANREPRLGAAFVVFSQLSRSVIIVFAALVFGTVRSIIAAAIVHAAIQSAILFLYLGKRFRGFWRRFDLTFLREHLIYALPVGLVGLLWRVQTDLHFYFVGYNFSSAEFAIYAVGCFQIPLIMMLSESVTAVLIPRMSELQMAGNRMEMIRLTALAARKLSLIYLPIYVFLLITAETFISLLFTRDYVESVPVFRVFITMLPLGILISDPIVRAHPELGRFMLKLRIVSSMVLVALLYLVSGAPSLTSMIAVVIVVRIFDMVIAETTIFGRIGFKRSDLRLFSGVVRVALCAAIAGVVTFALHSVALDKMPGFINSLVSWAGGTLSVGLAYAVEDGIAILGAGIVFGISYILLIYKFGDLEQKEKDLVAGFLRFKKSVG